jgi:hypothetical protein
VQHAFPVGSAPFCFPLKILKTKLSTSTEVFFLTGEQQPFKGGLFSVKDIGQLAAGPSNSPIPGFQPGVVFQTAKNTNAL